MDCFRNEWVSLGIPRRLAVAVLSSTWHLAAVFPHSKMWSPWPGNAEPFSCSIVDLVHDGVVAHFCHCVHSLILWTLQPVWKAWKARQQLSPLLNLGKRPADLSTESDFSSVPAEFTAMRLSSFSPSHRENGQAGHPRYLAWEWGHESSLLSLVMGESLFPWWSLLLGYHQHLLAPENLEGKVGTVFTLGLIVDLSTEQCLKRKSFRIFRRTLWCMHKHWAAAWHSG